MLVVKNKLGINNSTATIFRKWTNHSGMDEKGVNFSIQS